MGQRQKGGLFGSRSLEKVYVDITPHQSS